MLDLQFFTQKVVVKSLASSKIRKFVPINKPPHLTGVYCFLLLFILASCSTFRLPGRSTSSFSKGNYKEMTAEDYADHLASLKGSFLATPGIEVVKLKPASQKYIEGLTSQVIAKNEIFFKNLKKANITILNTDMPLHFSLPKGEIFLSKGLISKYMKHESMLVSILSYELVRSENLLYPKLTLVPVGFVQLERMLALSRLNLEERMDIHKWAHDLTVRSGYDGEYYLSWLQMQNRNTADFLMQVGDVNLISREESLFKAFLIQNASNEDQPQNQNSSKGFYNFLNNIRDV